MARVLVTGGAGFIGSHLVDGLLADGFQVTVVDDLSRGLRQNINKQARFIHQQIQSPSLRRCFKAYKFDFVFHLAAQINLQYSKNHPIEDAETNILGSLNVIRLASEFKVKKLIFFSSAAVYNIFDKAPNNEKDCPLPATPYGIAKRTVELYLLQSALNYTIIRPANVYGPRQRAEGEGGVVAVFCQNSARGQQSKINNTGRQTRDFTYVADVVKAVQKSLIYGNKKIINVSTNKETTVNELYNSIYSLAKMKIKPKRGYSLNEQEHSRLANNQAMSVLHWRPKENLSGGLIKTFNWFNEEYGKKD
ncbi:MAG: NAD-dependent epimerase/dehydratase family protein [Patescibacteria group bacterium]|jgi:UDP-glucose 4-epimerase